MKMKKLLASLLIACLLVSLMAACGSGGTDSTAAPDGTPSGEGASGDGEPAPSSGDGVVLQALWFSDGGEGESFQRLAEAYKETNPGVTIEIIEVPYDEMDNRTKNMLAANQPPALMRQSNIAQYVNQLIDLRDYTEAGAAFENNFIEGGLRTQYGGKMIGAPMDLTANGLIYNKTAFDQAGVDVPTDPSNIWTWSEFEDSLKQVMAEGGVTYGLAYDRTPQRFTTLMYQAGGSILNEAQTEPNFGSDGTVRAVEWFKSLHDQGIIPDSVWLGAEDPNNLFRTGQVATHLGGSWLITNYVDQITDFEWGVTYMPYEVQRSSIPGGKYLSAFDGTGMEKEAALFIEWISTPENNAQYCLENYFISPVVGNEVLDYDFGSEFFEIFNNELTSSPAIASAEWSYQEFTTQIQNDMRDSLAEVLAGSMSVEDYVAEMNDKSVAALENLA